MSWQPGETAPTNGDTVLGAFWFARTWVYGLCHYSHRRSSWMDRGETCDAPKFWMLLPAAPESAA